MESKWIHLSPSLKNGILLINNVDSERFPLFLNRIVNEMKQNAGAVSVFTMEEREKLMSSFSLDEKNLDLILNTCIILLCQAVYNITKPEKLKNILTDELKMKEENALSFANIWAHNAKHLILKMKQKSVYTTQLEDVSWLVNVEIASGSNEQTFVPKSVLQLKMKEGDGSSQLHLELEEKDLFKLYNTLENIQGALDSLI